MTAPFLGCSTQNVAGFLGRATHFCGYYRGVTETAADQPRLTPKGRATRERILEAAMALIAAGGVAGTSTEDVRRAAGVSGGQLSHYFASKQALVSAVITRQADALTRPGAPMSGLLDSMDALHAWADAAVAFQQDNIGRTGCTLGALAGELSVADEQARHDLNNGFLRWQELLHDGLSAMQARGDLHPDADPRELGLALITALAGGNVISQTMRDTRPLRASLNAALAYVASFTPAQSSRGTPARPA
jgi:TetR/AcrR family transcriptional regulator, transcriptional repressor for nem operon